MTNVNIHAIVNSETEITLRNQFEKDVQLVKSDKYKQAKIYLSELLTEKHDYIIGEFYYLGYFSEYTGFQAYKEGVQTYVKVFDTCKENQGMDVWYARVCSEFEKQVNTHFEKVREVREVRERAYIKTKKYRESFLARDIVDFINRNSQYITEKAVIQYMRGNKAQLNAEIEELPDFVPYKNYSESEIHNLICRLISDGIIEEKMYDGIFMILRPRNEDYRQVLENVKEDEITCDPFSKQKFNDFEAEKIFFDYEKKINLTMKDYMMLFCLKSAKGFFIRYYDEYVCLMQAAPKEFKAYVKMKIDAEDNAFMKKFLKEILQKS